MSTIVTRAGKGSPLTNAEVDANFTNLNDDKLESADLSGYAELTGAEFTGEVDATGFNGDLTGAILFKGQAGEALTKGDPVYISGISGNKTVVSKADANDASKMPCFGIVDATVSLNADCSVVTFGTLQGLDTSGFTEGDELFVSDTGTLTTTAPTGEASLLQKLAKVTRSHQTAGSIKVMGAGRTNAVPNLNDGNFFLGNGSNQAVSADFSDSVLGEISAGTGISISATGEIANTAPDQTVSLTGAGTTSVTGTYPNFTITGAGTTYTAGTGITLTGSEFSLTDTNTKLNTSGGTLTGNLTFQGNGTRINLPEHHYINYRFEMDDVDNNGTVYVLLCQNAANNDVNGRITMDRTSGLRHACAVDIVVSSGNSSDPKGSLVANSVTGAAAGASYKLVTVTYNTFSYVALEITNPDNYYETFGAYFTGRLKNTSTNYFLVKTADDLSDITDISDGSARHTFQGDLEVFDNIEVDGTVDGRDIATDGTKLDTIETNADVTDTDNVTAAGALMDSEVTNLAQVKGFDSSDYATAAQGTKADAALPTTGGTMTGNISFGDSTLGTPKQITFGDSDDFAIYHDSINSYVVETGAGGLILGGVSFVDIGNGTTESYAQFSTDGISLADNKKIQLGESDDLEIHHDGSNSYVVDGGTGNLYIGGSSYVDIGNGASGVGGQTYARFNTSGSCDLKYNNVNKLSTTNTGIDVSGTATMDGLAVGTTSDAYSQVLINSSTTGESELRMGDTDTDAGSIAYTNSDDTMTFRAAAGARMSLDSSGLDVTGTVTADGLSLGDSEKATFGASGDLEIYHNGAHSFISDVGNGSLFLRGDTQVRLQNGSENAVLCQKDAGVTVYYNNSAKLATTNTGVSVTGDIAVSGTVDGRLVGTDGARLDTIPYHRVKELALRSASSSALALSTNLVDIGTILDIIHPSTPVAASRYVDLKLYLDWRYVSSNTNDLELQVTIIVPFGAPTVNLGSYTYTYVNYAGSGYVSGSYEAWGYVSGDVTHHFTEFGRINKTGTSSGTSTKVRAWQYNESLDRTYFLAESSPGFSLSTGDTVYWHPYDWESAGTALYKTIEIDERYVSYGHQSESLKFKVAYDDSRLTYRFKMKEVTTTDSAVLDTASVTLTDVGEV